MTDHPILFSAPMIRALLDGRKTQTRRLIKQPSEMNAPSGCKTVSEYCTGAPEHGLAYYWRGVGGGWNSSGPIPIKYRPGDRLWVREAHWAWGHWETTDELTKTGKPKRRFVRDWTRPAEFKKPMSVQSDKIDHNTGFHARLGRFMFQADSRLTLTVTDVRVQRLQDISEADARAEGATGRDAVDEFGHKYTGWSLDWHEDADSETGVHLHCLSFPRHAFGHLWNIINGPDAWGANPWVVATSFEVHKCNIDQMEAA